MGVPETAVGAILNIPPQAIKSIERAEKAIWALHDASLKTANQVYGDFSKRMPMGVDVFIRKLAEAKAAMDNMGSATVTLDTTQAVQAGEDLSSQMQRTSDAVSQAVQEISATSVDASGVSALAQSAERTQITIEQLEKKIKEIENERDTLDLEKYSPVSLNNAIEKLKEYIALKKKSEEQLARTKTDPEKDYLAEQKRLMTDLLNIRKQINAQSTKVQTGRITGNEKIKEEEEDLRSLFARYQESYRALQTLNAEKGKDLGAAARTESEVNAEKYKTEVLKQQIAYRQKLSAEITRANELTAQGQQGKTRLGSGEEAAIQRQLNSDYKAMLKIIKEQGVIRAKVAAEGRRMTQDEINLINTLSQRYQIYNADVNRIAGAYKNMAAAAEKNFQADKSEQLARNAILLADAQRKAFDIARKIAEAQAAATKHQAEQDRRQAETDLNRLYTERLRLLKEKEQLENKALINNAKGLPDLTAKENQLLTELTAKLQSVDRQIQTIGNSYAGLAAKTKKAFELSELRQAVKAQNQFNKEIEGIDASKAKEMTDEYKKLYAECLRLLKSMREYNNSPATIGNVPASAASAYSEIDARWQEVCRRMNELEREGIQEIADFRKQKEMERRQQSLSEFIQTEAQKRAELQKSAQLAGQQYAQSYAGAMKQFENMMTGNASGKLTVNLENVKRVLNDLQTAAGKLDLLDPSDAIKAEKLKGAIQELNRIIQQYNTVANAKPEKPLISPTDAINAAKSATTLQELQNAYKELKAVMATTDPKSAEWAALNATYADTKDKIDEIKDAMGELQGESNNTSNVMGQLRNQIAAAFSIQQISNFIKKVVETRAQFELQNIALRALLQDKSEADKIFAQVQQMALESPFNIMQLNTYTKNLAAYRVETEKLLDTTKMLADVSAGLGVEMDRLILAYGQVKSANFLRGTEVRQFTEAGLNIAGELAKYFSELQGRMVSVGEVMDMITKRMVRFEDVEEVFKRVTSAGGMFYDMQKKQANSLYGMMQRIKDSYDIMLNEIGRSNDTIIKFALNTIRELINHWRELKPIILGTVVAMGTYTVVAAGMKILPIILSNIKNGFLILGKMIGRCKNAQVALNATMMANPYAAVAAVLTSLIVVVGQLIMEQNALAEAMERVREEGYGDMYELITQYKELADTVRDANKPYKERTEALDELKRVFADILPAEMLELDYIKKMAAGYNEATAAIKAYSAEKMKANLQAEIDNELGKDITDSINSVAKQITRLVDLPDNMPKDTFKSIVKTMLEQMKQEVKNGDLKVEDFWKEFQNRLASKFELVIPKDKWDRIWETWKTQYTKHGRDYSPGNTLVEQLKEYSHEMSGIELGLGDIESNELVIAKSQYEALTKAVKDYKDAVTALRDAKDKGTLNSVSGNTTNMTADTKAGQDAVDNLIQKYRIAYNAADALGVRFSMTAEDINAAINSQSQEMNYFEKVTNSTLLAASKNVDNFKARFRNDKSVVAFFENLQGNIDAIDFSGPQQQIFNMGVMLANQMGISVSVLDKLRIESINSFGDAATAASKLKEQLDDNVLAMQNMIMNAVLFGKMSKDEVTPIAEMWYGGGNTLEENKQMAEYYDKLAKMFGALNKSRSQAKSKSRTSTTDKELKRLQDLKKRLEEVNKKYEDLRKTMSADDATQRINDLYEPIFKTLGSDINKFFNDGEYDSNALIKALGKLLGMFKRTSQERKEFAADIEEGIAQTKIDIDTKNAEKRIDEVKKKIEHDFSSFELTKELKDLGLNVNMTFLLGGEPIDLRELKARLQAGFESIGGEKGPEEEVKHYKDAFKKITDLELKEQKERVKKYYQYTVKSVGERAKIELDYLKKIDEVRETYALTEQQRQEAINNLIEERDKKLAEQTWKDFKDSNVYQMMFDDMEVQPTKALELLRSQLVNLKKESASSLTFRQLKEINNAIKQIDEQLAERNPFKTLVSGFKEIFSMSPGLKKMNDEYTGLIKRISELSKENEDLEVELNRKRDKSNLYKTAQIEKEIEQRQNEIFDLEGEDATEDDKQRIDVLLKEIKALRDKRDELEKIIDLNRKAEEEMYDNIQDLENRLGRNTAELKGGIYEDWDYGEGLEKEAEELDGKTKNIYDTINRISNASKSIKDYSDTIIDGIDNIITGLDDMVGLSDEFKDTWTAAKDIFSNSLEMFDNMENLALTAFTTKNPKELIKGSLALLGSVTKVVGSIFKIWDNKKQREIESLQEKVENLKKAYEDLEVAMDEAFTFNEYNASYKSAMSALNEQAHAYDEMIRLEEAKKKTDEDKLKEYKEAREEIEKAKKELRETRYEEYGSINKKEYLNEAEAFVSAWLDAYKETGDGLDGLIEHWDEFFNNLVMKQAASAVVSKRMSKYIDMINAAIDRGENGLSFAQTVKTIGEEFKKEMGDINEGLKEFWETLGLSGTGDYILSDLQQGIQNITEPQAAAIEAYLNSIRFEVFNHTQLLNTLITSIQMQYGGNEENPMLTELKGIHSVLDNIYSTLHDVVKTEVGRKYIQVG